MDNMLPKLVFSALFAVSGCIFFALTDNDQISFEKFVLYTFVIFLMIFIYDLKHMNNDDNND